MCQFRRLVVNSQSATEQQPAQLVLGMSYCLCLSKMALSDEEKTSSLIFYHCYSVAWSEKRVYAYDMRVCRDSCFVKALYR